MRPHIDGAGDARRKIHGPDVIEEYERPDHAAFLEGQHASDFESAEIAAALVDHHFEHRVSPLACRHDSPPD
jgi:hypothetical protein